MSNEPIVITQNDDGSYTIPSIILQPKASAPIAPAPVPTPPPAVPPPTPEPPPAAPPPVETPPPPTPAPTPVPVPPPIGPITKFPADLLKSRVPLTSTNVSTARAPMTGTVTYSNGDLIVLAISGNSTDSKDDAFPVKDSANHNWSILNQIGNAETQRGIMSYLYGFVASEDGSTTITLDCSNALMAAGVVAYVFQGIPGYNWLYQGSVSNVANINTYAETATASIAAMSGPGVTLIRAMGNEGYAVSKSSYAFSIGTNLGPSNLPVPAQTWNGYNTEDAGVQAYISNAKAASATPVVVKSTAGYTHMLVCTDNFVLTTSPSNIATGIAPTPAPVPPTSGPTSPAPSPTPPSAGTPPVSSAPLPPMQPIPTDQFKYVRGYDLIAPVLPATTLPPVGSTWVDPSFGNGVQRFTDNTEWSDDGGSLRNIYSRYPCESIDGKYVLVYGVGSPSCYIQDRATGNKIREVFNASGHPIGEGNDIRWHYKHPSILIYHDGMKLYKFDVTDGSNTLVRDFTADFPGAQGLNNGEEGNSSYDGRYWCYMAQILDGNGFYPIAIFVYDMEQNTIVGTMTPTSPGVMQGADDAKHNPPWPMPNPNMVEVSPDGKWALIDWNRCWSSGGQTSNANLIGTHMDGPHAYPLNLDYTKAVKVGVNATHSAWALNAAGVWGFCSQNNRNDYIEWVDPNGVGYHDDGTGVVRLLSQSQIGWNTGFHFAGSAGMPGWVLISINASDNTQPGDNQVMLLPIEANCNPLRVSHTYNIHNGAVQSSYFQEGSACITNDAKRIYWPGNYDGTYMVTVFRTELPDDWMSKASLT